MGFLVVKQSPSFCLQGMPDWEQVVKELPPMDAFLSKIER